MKQDIRNISFEDLQKYLKTIGEPAFRVEQIFQWIYQKGAWGFEDMTNLPRKLRERLQQAYDLKPNVIAQKLASEDSTTKFL